MSPRNKLLAMNQYKGVDTGAAAEYADGVQLIQMLFSALLDSISDADGHIQRGDLAKKGDSITRAQKIVSGLRLSLDFERGGELARNLDDLYEYANRRLINASASNDVEALREVKEIISDISSAWQLIPSLMKPQDTAAA